MAAYTAGTVTPLQVGAVLCCAMLCYVVLFCAVLCCAVLCCAVLCCVVLCCAVLRCAVLCCAVLCCAVLCYAVLCCAVLCCVPKMYRSFGCITAMAGKLIECRWQSALCRPSRKPTSVRAALPPCLDSR